jgi:hypothetical protein
MFDLGGIIGAIIGSILVLLAVSWFFGRGGRVSRPRGNRLRDRS